MVCQRPIKSGPHCGGHFPFQILIALMFQSGLPLPTSREIYGVVCSQSVLTSQLSPVSPKAKVIEDFRKSLRKRFFADFPFDGKSGKGSVAMPRTKFRRAVHARRSRKIICIANGIVYSSKKGLQFHQVKIRKRIDRLNMLKMVNVFHKIIARINGGIG